MAIAVIAVDRFPLRSFPHLSNVKRQSILAAKRNKLGFTRFFAFIIREEAKRSVVYKKRIPVFNSYPRMT